jgi:flagellar hook-associated protein FlgK
VLPLNAGNTTVATTADIDKNATLANPTNIVAGGDLTGTLTINVDGINPAGVPPGIKVNYQINSSTGGPAVPAGTIDATTIDSFITGFNAQQLGVTASYDPTSQTVVFARDPTNISLAHRAAMAAAVPPGTTTPAFTITDSNTPVGTPQPPLGTAATGILEAFGADAMNGVQQNNTNAIGVTNGADVTALQSLFSASFGVPALQTTSPTVVAPGVVTVFPPAAAPTAFAQLNVGDVLTLDGGNANQENVTITAINRNTGTITFTAANAHAANFTITSAQVQPLQKYYANLVANMGQDAANATTGNTTQTSLASSINQVRQSTDGINIDEETQNLVKFQNAYGAAAHVMTVLSSMLSDAINLGSGTSF